MSEENYKKIFAKNLSYYMKKNEKTQTDLINDLGINKSAISTWINATRLPRMDKVQLLADYFGINKSDLLEERTEDTGYYLNPETAKVAQEVFENRDLRVLFDAARDASPEDIKTATSVLKALLAKERGKDDETGA